MNSTIKMIENQWAKHKYSVLAKSHTIYLEIRELLKDKSNHDLTVEFEGLLKKAYHLPDNPGEMINAYHHVFGYFKKVATSEEKKHFLSSVELFKEGTISDVDIKRFLYQLVLKYQVAYLLESTYFK